MTQKGINLPRVQILKTDISIPKPGVNVEILVIAAGGRGQGRANSNDNNAFFHIFLIQILSF
jgi:hypothetical protein